MAVTSPKRFVSRSTAMACSADKRPPYPLKMRLSPLRPGECTLRSWYEANVLGSRGFDATRLGLLSYPPQTTTVPDTRPPVCA